MRVGVGVRVGLGLGSGLGLESGLGLGFVLVLVLGLALVLVLGLVLGFGFGWDRGGGHGPHEVAAFGLGRVEEHEAHAALSKDGLARVSSRPGRGPSSRSGRRVPNRGSSLGFEPCVAYAGVAQLARREVGEEALGAPLEEADPQRD